MSNGAKVMTVTHWKDVSRKYNVEDCDDSQSALAAYQALEESEHENRLKAIALANKHAIELKKDAEIDKAVLKQLADHDWNLESIARKYGLTPNDVLLQYESNGYGWLFHQHVMDAARAYARKRS